MMHSSAFGKFLLHFGQSLFFWQKEHVGTFFRFHSFDKQPTKIYMYVDVCTILWPMWPSLVAKKMSHGWLKLYGRKRQKATQISTLKLTMALSSSSTRETLLPAELLWPTFSMELRKVGESSSFCPSKFVEPDKLVHVRFVVVETRTTGNRENCHTNVA